MQFYQALERLLHTVSNFDTSGLNSKILNWSLLCQDVVILITSKAELSKFLSNLNAETFINMAVYCSSFKSAIALSNFSITYYTNYLHLINNTSTLYLHTQ